MIKFKNFLIHSSTFLIVFMLLVMPTVSLAQGWAGLVPCGKGDSACTFGDFLKLINNVLDFILKKMVVPIAGIMFAYAGFLMVTAGGEAAHARQEAKEIAFNTVLGLIFAVAAVLIVKTILSILGYEGSTWVGFYQILYV